MSESLPALEQDILFFLMGLREADEIIRDNEVSKYAIFVFSDRPMEIGVELFTPESSGKKWYVYASTVENFATKGLIQADKIEHFLETYRHHTDQFCLFVVRAHEGKFVFIDKNYDLKRNN